MKEQPNLRIFEIVILNTKWKYCNLQNFVFEKFYVHEKCLLTKNLLPEKRNEM